jgi:hypothetical protein
MEKISPLNDHMSPPRRADLYEQAEKSPANDLFFALKNEADVQWYPNLFKNYHHQDPPSFVACKALETVKNKLGYFEVTSELKNALSDYLRACRWSNNPFPPFSEKTVENKALAELLRAAEEAMTLYQANKNANP